MYGMKRLGVEIDNLQKIMRGMKHMLEIDVSGDRNREFIRFKEHLLAVLAGASMRIRETDNEQIKWTGGFGVEGVWMDDENEPPEKLKKYLLGYKT